MENVINVGVGLNEMTPSSHHPGEALCCNGSPVGRGVRYGGDGCAIGNVCLVCNDVTRERSAHPKAQRPYLAGSNIPEERRRHTIRW